MNLAKKFRKIAEGYPSRKERDRRKYVRQKVRRLTKDILDWCRRLAIDGKMSYDWYCGKYEDDEILSNVIERLKKRGFTVTRINEESGFYIHIFWEK
jgi:hypothetical protein